MKKKDNDYSIFSEERYDWSAKHTAFEAIGFPLDEAGLVTVAVYVQRLLRRDGRFNKDFLTVSLLVEFGQFCLVRCSNVGDF